MPVVYHELIVFGDHRS